MDAKTIFIPKLTTLGTGLTIGRTAGILAVEAMGKARQNAPRQNKYIDGIDPINKKDPALSTLSQLGTLIWDRVMFPKTKYIDEYGQSKTTPEITFEAILISVSFPRNIVKTSIQGRPGTVKEYIGEGDAQITFRGVIAGANGHYPIEEVSVLKDILKAPVPIPVISRYLQNLDIHSVVFEDRTIDQEDGGYSYQTFSINAISDTPQELLISDTIP